MDQVIDEILKTEKKSEKIIEEARKKEAELLQSVEDENNRIITMAQKDAQALIQKSVILAKEQAERECQDALGKAKSENEEFLRQNEKQLDSTIHEIIRFIVTPEYRRD